MAIDQALFELAEGPTLRFYGWDPHAISLGHFQGRRGEDLSPLRALGLPLVRRMTGGGAIVHAEELTWSLTLPRTHPLIDRVDLSESYAVLQEPIRLALQELGVSAHRSPPEDLDSKAGSALLCFHRKTNLDLLVGDRKLAGAAQRRSRERTFIHGSLLLSAHEHQRGSAALDEVVGREVTPEELAMRLRPHFEGLLGKLEVGDLAPEEFDRAQKLRASSALP